MMTFATVLKTGGIYQSHHVTRLVAQIDAHYSAPHRHVCLTDDATVAGVDTLALQRDWPGFWSKLELFEHDMGRVCFLDLDVTVLASIDWLDGLDLTGPHLMYAMHDAFHPDTMNSSVMLWDRPMPELADGFDPGLPREMLKGTDQLWVHQRLQRKSPEAVVYLEPPLVCSFKKHGLAASIVAFHGKPKPWDADEVQRWRAHHAKHGRDELPCTVAVN
jgi:hypothetical protein